MTLAVLLVATQLADVATTAAFLRLGGEERFWVSKWIIDNVGMLGYAAAKTALGVWLAAMYLNGEMPDEIAWGLLAFYAYVIVNNLLLIQKLKTRKG